MEKIIVCTCGTDCPYVECKHHIIMHRDLPSGTMVTTAPLYQTCRDYIRYLVYAGDDLK